MPPTGSVGDPLGTDAGKDGPRPVCMIVHAYYEEDPRVRREAEALVAAGRPVDVFALRHPGAGPTDDIEGVTLHRLPVARHQGASLATYAIEYLYFLARATWAVREGHRRRAYGLVHVHTLPDGLVFAALPLRMAGIPVVLDLHEAMPEFFRSRFPRQANPLTVGLLRLQERLAIAAADALLTVNDALAERLIRLGVPASKITVLLNTPAPNRFVVGQHASRPFMADGVLRLVYAGALTPTYELEVLLEGMAEIARHRPDLDVRAELYGRGDLRDRLANRATALGIADRVALHGRVPLESVAAAIAAADIGVAPTRQDAFTDFSLSTKILEYAVMGKPVVASRLPTVERYFSTETLSLYVPGDARDLARAILRLVDDPAERASRLARTDQRLVELGWERETDRYLALVERLALDGRDRQAAPSPPVSAAAVSDERPTVAERPEPTLDG
ncbi:MAG TPA: glycosyltransferase [Candidatus Limnocylindrales bacterium]|jgi:glycosyltransferase involved in cell wall biosynthesis|nr:glycosyltransferase [Candidatus Limnocylindrales bacterium]